MAPRSPTEKVKLFRQLFRGRDDLYSTRFVSKKTGKAGYAPACANKFVVGLCELPKVKCGECANRREFAAFACCAGVQLEFPARRIREVAEIWSRSSG